MRFTVVYQTPAEDSLALLWVNSPDRAAIAEAADTIDALLRDDAHLRGESRSGNERVMFVPPLGVHFDVNEEDRLVRVLEIWRIREGNDV